MTTKLTLTIEDKVIEAAKKYAQSSGKSLSGMVENYLRSLSSAGGEKSGKHMPQVSRLMGVIELPEDFDYKKGMAAAVARKHRK